MKFAFKPSPNYRNEQSTSSIMMELTIGLLVVFAAGCLINFKLNGTTALLHCIVALLVCLIATVGTEIVWCVVLKKDVTEHLFSSYPWVTGIIIALTVRPNVSYFALAVASVMAIYFGKLVFGGFGQNIFNPAGVGRAIIALSFGSAVVADVVSGATPTSTISSYGWLLNEANASAFLADFGGLTNMALGLYQGAIGETCSVLLILVGVVLAWRKVIDWKVPTIYVSTVFVLSLLVGFMNGQGIWYPIFSILTGGVLFGAVFMLTDPVTNPTSSSGRVIFAMGAGLLTVLIRVKASLPEGVLFSILLMNMLTPAIEKWCDGNQIKNIKNLQRNVVITAVVSVAVAAIAGFSMKASDANYVNVNTKVIANANYSEDSLANVDTTNVKIISEDNGTYVVACQGFQGENEFTIKVENGAITSFEVTSFNDTPGIGDVITNEDFTGEFVGATLASEIDAKAGATFSSNSALAAASAALAAGN